MDMSGFFPLLWWTLGGTAVVGAAVYMFMEYQAYLLRTKVINIPGGLRFVAQSFAVEVRHAAKEILVLAKDGRYSRQSLPDGEEQVQSGALSVTLAAAGLRIEVARVSVKDGQDGKPLSTGLSRVVFWASDEPLRQAQGRQATEHSELRLDNVPDMIALDFQQFANGLRAWIEKIEHRLATEAVAQRQREEEAAAAAAKAASLAAAPVEDTSVPQSEEERKARANAQLDKWRQAAGFSGTSTEMHFDDMGRIVWLIDLDQSGRVILHAANRTFHGSLKGASVVGMGTELEIAVRDEYWSEGDPPVVFRLMAGVAPDIRRAWKERVELLIQSLGGSPGQRR